MSATMAARARPAPSISAPAVRRPANAKARARSSWVARLGHDALRRPGRALVLVAFAAVAGMILVNALMLQRARHPAPMLAAPSQGMATRPAERRAEPAPAAAEAPASQQVAPPAALPPARPAGLDREMPVRPPATVPAAPRQAPAPTPAAARPAAPARDPIADLINGGDLRPPADIRGTATRSAAAPRRGAEN
ncbi:MAG: hypothetical protein DI527_06500 [Chelatococcus sp.]|nr:MAG: hypothetical protein DI527_06500 [Chelatococcus sp.]